MDTCATLGHSFQREDFDPSDRTPENGWVVDRPADCLNDGRGHFRCTICNRARTRRMCIPRTGHKWSQSVDYVPLNIKDASDFIPVYLCTNSNCPGCSLGGDMADGSDPITGTACMIARDEIKRMLELDEEEDCDW